MLFLYSQRLRGSQQAFQGFGLGVVFSVFHSSSGFGLGVSGFKVGPSCWDSGFPTPAADVFSLCKGFQGLFVRGMRVLEWGWGV